MRWYCGIWAKPRGKCACFLTSPKMNNLSLNECVVFVLTSACLREREIARRFQGTGRTSSSKRDKSKLVSVCVLEKRRQLNAETKKAEELIKDFLFLYFSRQIKEHPPISREVGRRSSTSISSRVLQWSNGQQHSSLECLVNKTVTWITRHHNVPCPEQRTGFLFMRRVMTPNVVTSRNSFII